MIAETNSEKKKFFKRKISFILIIVVSILIFSFGVTYTVGKDVTENQIKMVWISHTEYWRNDKASTIIRLADYRGNPFDVDSCIVNIKHPDKTPFVVAGVMAESSIAGNWYRTDSLVGQPLGTYEQEVICTKGTQQIISSQSFHLNPALEQISNLSNKAELIDLHLENMNMTLIAKINSSEEKIKIELNNMNSDLSNIMEAVNSSLNNQMQDETSTLSTQITSVNDLLNNKLTSINVSIDTTVQEVGGQMITSLESINSSLTNLIENELKTLILDNFSKMHQEIVAIKTQVDWIQTNAMNQDSMAVILDRFDKLNQSINEIETFCSNIVSQQTVMCIEAADVGTSVNLMLLEQNKYLTQINQTTLNTWQLLSGDITIKIDSILSTLGIIEGQTRAINQTTNEIKDILESEIRVSIIS